MDTKGFDRLTRALAGRVSRRGVIKSAAAGSVAGPSGMLIAVAAQGDGKDDKDKDKNKDRNRDDGRCRTAGEACEGGQTCCGGLSCQQAVGGLSYRCLPAGAGTTTTNVSGPAVANNNSVCAGDCAVEQNAAASTGANTTQGFGSVGPAGFGSLPPIAIEVECTYEEAAFQTVCLALGGHAAEGPVLTDIQLPFDGVCAVTIDRTFRPPRFEEVVVRKPAPGGGGGGGNASAGNGGTANASADGGTITIGDVNSGGNRGGDNDTNISVSADGGNANADASGGDGNVAVAGGGGGAAAEEVVRELRQVEPASLTVVLEGNVQPTRSATWFVDTEQGRFPATGPALERVAAEQAPETGSVLVTAFACPGGEGEVGGDWFGRCTDPAAPFDLTLTPVDGGSAGGARRLNDRGRTRFVDLAPGRYRLEAADGAWCRAESDAVNEAGEVVVEGGVESNVWLFTCPTA
jgi:hypothetical protein